MSFVRFMLGAALGYAAAELLLRFFQGAYYSYHPLDTAIILSAMAVLWIPYSRLFGLSPSPAPSPDGPRITLLKPVIQFPLFGYQVSLDRVIVKGATEEQARVIVRQIGHGEFDA